MDKPESILIVEDDAVIALYITKVLRKLDYHVFDVEMSGEGAVRAAGSYLPDLVLMDISLTGKMDGIEAAAEIHKSWSIPVVYLTAYADENSLRRAKATAPFGYLTKPFDDRALQATIEMALNKARLEKRLKESETALRQRNQDLSALYAIATALQQSRGIDRTLLEVLDQVIATTGFDAGSIQLLNEGQQSLSLTAQRNMPVELIEAWSSVAIGDGPLGGVARTGQPALISNSVLLQIEPLEKSGLRALLAVPMVSKDQVVGVICLYSFRREEFDSPVMQFLGTVGHELGAAIENLRLANEAAEIEILQEITRLRSELIANVSHELRTPLGLIKIFATTLLRNDVVIDPETQREFLEDIDHETDKLEAIVDNLLDLSRLEGRRFELNRAPVELGQLAQEVVNSLRVQLMPGQRFESEFPTEPLVAVVDARRIEQVLRNLLINAIKYTPGGGMITVGGHSQGSQAVLWVSDQGIGISADDQKRVFERFYRVENAVTRQQHGTGLGLSVAQGIVEAHGGQMWVESDLGVGTQFYFTIPLDLRT